MIVGDKLLFVLYVYLIKFIYFTSFQLYFSWIVTWMDLKMFSVSNNVVLFLPWDLDYHDPLLVLCDSWATFDYWMLTAVACLPLGLGSVQDWGASVGVQTGARLLIPPSWEWAGRAGRAEDGERKRSGEVYRGKWDTDQHETPPCCSNSSSFMCL